MVKIVESEVVDINLLIKANYNPRKISRKIFDALKDEIDEIGFLDPVIVNVYPGREYIIIGGHQRFEAMRALGATQIEVKKISVDPVREKKLNIQLNKLTGEFDNDMLAELIYALTEDGETCLDLGFKEEEIQGLIDKVSGPQKVGIDIDIEICAACGQKIKKK